LYVIIYNNLTINKLSTTINKLSTTINKLSTPLTTLSLSNMSAENVIQNTIGAEVKQKKPVLPSKYSKLLNFGFWLSTITESEALLDKLMIFGTIEEQTELFDRFFAEEKDTAKLIRKRIAEHNKPPKPVKEKMTKAPRKSKAVVHTDELISQLIADANAVVVEPKDISTKITKEQEKEAAKIAKEQEKEAAKIAKEQEKEAAKIAKEQEKEVKTKEKKRKATKVAETEKAPVQLGGGVGGNVDSSPDSGLRSKKESDSIAENQLVNPPSDELIAEVIEEIAPQVLGSDTKNQPAAEHIKPKAAKAKAPKDTKQKAPKDTKQKAAKDTKPKAEKKTKQTIEPVQPVEEEEEEIQTRIATIGDKDYLIDQDFNVYNIEEPHDLVGTYNQETGAIDAL